MAVIETSEPTSDVAQKNMYNNGEGGIIVRQSFSIPDNTAWAVVGTVLAGAATPADVEATLQPAIEALSEVTSVNGNKIWGQVPDPIEVADHSANLYVESYYTATILGATGKTFGVAAKNTRMVTVAAGAKWVVWCLRVPAALVRTSIDALEAAMEGITGISNAVHLIDSESNVEQQGNGTLRVTTHLRIEPTEV